MDPVESFIKLGRKFSLASLQNTHARLCSLQVNKGSILYEDILQSLTCVMRDTNAQELNAHAALLFEACLCPIVNSKSQMTLQMKPELINNEHAFIKNLLYVMYSRTGGMEAPTVEEFKADAIVFLKSCTPPPPPPQYPPRVIADLAAIGIAQPPLQSRIEFEKSEPIIRLLAQLRKIGMDILFPQTVHDKVLACIFVAIRASSTPAHRELIDMVMSVRESNTISQLESISKTKIRGVLALLKHGNLLVTSGADGEPVRLQLAYGISSFKEFRDRHDAFLTRCMSEHHLNIPAILKCELIWQFDEEVTMQRLDAMNKLMARLQYFYAKFISAPIKSSLHPEYREAAQFVPPALAGNQPKPYEDGRSTGGYGTQRSNHVLDRAYVSEHVVGGGGGYGGRGGAAGGYDEEYIHRGGGGRRGGAGAHQQGPYGYGQQSQTSPNFSPYNNNAASHMNQGRYPAGGAGFSRGSAQQPPPQGYGYGRDNAGGRGGAGYGGYGGQIADLDPFSNAGPVSDVGTGGNSSGISNKSLSANAPSFRPQFSTTESVFGSSAPAKTDFDYLSSGTGLGRIAVGSSQASPLFSTTGALSGLGDDWGARFGGIDGGSSGKNALDFAGNSFFNVDSLSKAIPDVVSGSGLGLAPSPGLGSFGSKTVNPTAAFFDQGEDIILDKSGETALDSIIDYTQEPLSTDDK
jgi:uncharacterized membrane protein YgcG